MMPRLAAVVMPIFEDAPNDVVFVERASHLRRHAGEIAFPGGALDDADGGDHARAALRELHEEIGIPEGAVTLVGQLRSIVQRQGTFEVTPFVGIVAPRTPLVVDPNEASAAHRVPLAAILEPGAVHPMMRTVGERTFETYVFNYGALHVWGLTARILFDFLEGFRAQPSALRARLDERLAG